MKDTFCCTVGAIFVSVIVLLFESRFTHCSSVELVHALKGMSVAFVCTIPAILGSFMDSDD